jgi:hypothetical protein
MEQNIRTLVKELQDNISELRKNGITDDFDLEMKILDLMPEFYDNYPSLVKRLCRDEDQDNSYLYKMIDLLEDINNGKKTMENVEYNLGEELAQKFLYPVVNNINTQDTQDTQDK